MLCRKILEEIIAENFLNLARDESLQMQEPQHTCKEITSKKSTARPSRIKKLKLLKNHKS